MICHECNEPIVDVPSNIILQRDDWPLCRKCFYTRSDAVQVKPTLGVMPHNLWIEHRIQALARSLADRCNQIALHPIKADEKPIGDWALEIMKLRLGLRKDAE